MMEYPTVDAVLIRLESDDVGCEAYLRRWLLVWLMGLLDPGEVSVMALVRCVGVLESVVGGEA